MPEEPVQMDPEAIRTHAASIESLAGPMAQAVDAALAVSAPTDAFGKLCAFLPPLFMDSVEEDGIAALEAGQAAVVQDASDLRAAADSFAAADDAAAAALLQAGGEVAQ